MQEQAGFQGPQQQHHQPLPTLPSQHGYERHPPPPPPPPQQQYGAPPPPPQYAPQPPVPARAPPPPQGLWRGPDAYNRPPPSSPAGSCLWRALWSQ